MNLSLERMRDALAAARVGGVLAHKPFDGGAKESDGVVLYVPLLRLDHPDFEEAYGLLSCCWILWLRTTHCRLRIEATHVVAYFGLDMMDLQTFELLLASIKKAEMCFL